MLCRWQSIIVWFIHALVTGRKPFPKRKILKSSKLKEFADDIFIFDEIGRKLSKRVKNNVGKGEIAHYEQFLLSHCVFKIPVRQTRKNQGLFGKEINESLN